MIIISLFCFESKVVAANIRFQGMFIHFKSFGALNPKYFKIVLNHPFGSIINYCFNDGHVCPKH